MFHDRQIMYMELVATPLELFENSTFRAQLELTRMCPKTIKDCLMNLTDIAAARKAQQKIPIA